MQIYSKLETADLCPTLSSLLLAAVDAEPGEVWLVSPWLKNVVLPIAGHYASLFSSHRDSVSLGDLLTLLVRRHQVHVVTKPPGELVPLRDVMRLVTKIEVRERLLATEELQGYAIRDELVHEQNEDIRALADSAMRHADTLALGAHLASEGAKVYYLDYLHAKLFWSPVSAFFGSANFTNGGLKLNAELMVEVSFGPEHQRLGEIAAGFGARAKPAHAYSLSPALARAKIDAPAFLAAPGRLPAGEYTALRALLEGLCSMVQR